MKPHQALEKKFNPKIFHTQSPSKAPVSSSLRYLLQNESFRIQKLLNKKKDHENKLQKIASTNLQRRNSIKEKIKSEQKKHEQNKSNFLQKRVKGQRIKLKYAQNRTNQYQKQSKQKSQKQFVLYKEARTDTDNYFVKKALDRKRSDLIQSLVTPQYENAVQRKNFLQLRNGTYGALVQEQILKKNNSIKERKQNSFVNLKKEAFDLRNSQQRLNYEKSTSIKSERENKYVNKICFNQDRSSKHVKLNNKKSKERLEKRLAITKQNFYKKRTNLQQSQEKRIQSMKECRCHSKGFGLSSKITQSINLNEEDEDLKLSKIKRKMIERKYSVLSMRNSFTMKNNLHNDIVKMNKQYRQSDQDRRQQRYMMKDKQISEALSLRNSLKDESNCLIRKSRLFPTK